jgi:hypothetical protein
MSEETITIDPADLHLPTDYEDDLRYRLPPPIITSTDTSDDEDKNKSGETTPINPTDPNNPTTPNPFALLTSVINMTDQGTGANAQQLGNATNSVPLAPNIYYVVDKLSDLTIGTSKASYLSPDDIVKKYKELEVQYHKDKISNGKIICVILDFVKTFKDPPQEFEQFVEEIKKDQEHVSQLCDFQELSLSKAKEISELYSQPIEYPFFTKPDKALNPSQKAYARSAKEIVTVIGVFDPADKNHDFTQTWQVLLRYGKSNFFEEKDNIDALFHIWRGDAKTILIEFDHLNKSLKQILDHFASIYSVKRSLVSDRRAVENFTRIVMISFWIKSAICTQSRHGLS